jgi:hypothetical protein
MTAKTFTAVIYKAGINPCVNVPASILLQLSDRKGNIPVKGMIGNFEYKQTLIPVRKGEHRFFVNSIMLKSNGYRIGDTAEFTIELDEPKDYIIPVKLRTELEEEFLMPEFQSLSKSRKMDICNYINGLKTAKAINSNVEKVINQLKEI